MTIPATTSAVIPPSAAERNKIFKAMTPALQKVAQALDVKNSQEVQSILLANWDKGKHIETVIREEGEYGSSAVEQLAAYLCTSPTALYDLRNYTQTYTREEVKDLGERKMENGRRIALGHLMAIMRVRSVADRKKLITQTFANSLTTNELAHEITSKFEMKNKRSGGRKPSMPTSPAAGIDQIRSRCLELKNRLKPWTEGIFDELDEAEPSKFSPAMLEKMEKADVEMRETASGLEAAHSRLSKNIDRARRVLSQRKPEDKEKPTRPGKPVATGKPKASLPSKKSVKKRATVAAV